MSAVIDAIKSDPTTNKLVEDTQQLVSHLLFDARGNVTWKPEELRQFKILLMSLILEELKYIPIPRLDGSTDKYDFCVQNAHFYGYDLLPDHITVKWENKLDLNLKDVATDQATSVLSISMNHIKTHMRNVMFWFRKKSGLIRMEDSGLADVDLTGDGASLLIELEYDVNRRPSGFNIRRVSLDMDKLRIHVVDSHYDWLLNLLSPLVSNDIKRSIEREVEGRIKYTFNRIFMQLSAIQPRPEMQKAAEIVKQEVKDVQRVKNALEAAPHTA